jgi:hypothetical protein
MAWLVERVSCQLCMQAQLAEANLQLAKEQEATRKAEGDCGALRSKLLHVSVRTCEPSSYGAG